MAGRAAAQGLAADRTARGCGVGFDLRRALGGGAQQGLHVVEGLGFEVTKVLVGGVEEAGDRGYVLTCQGLDALRPQMHGAARRRGLGQAARVLVMGDGAGWIWRLADDRWPQARQRLDFYHAVPHLAAVGRALWGEDQEQFQAWLKPLVRQRKNDSAGKVIRQWEDAVAGWAAGPGADVVARELAALKTHQERRDYRAGRRAGEPMGSGAVEATGRPAQCRFQRPGQFWSPMGNEALLCLETFWRNDRWALLFPHTAFNPARNSDAPALDQYLATPDQRSAGKRVSGGVGHAVTGAAQARISRAGSPTMSGRDTFRVKPSA